MKREFLPFYVSRALLSLAFSFLVFRLTWIAVVVAGVLFALFVLYLHSGWFKVDPASPLFPIRRDERGREVQRRALIAAVVVGAAAYLAFSTLAAWAAYSSLTGSLAVSLAIVAYFAAQFILFVRA